MGVIDKLLQDSGIKPGEFCERLAESNKTMKQLIREMKKLNQNIEKLVNK